MKKFEYAGFHITENYSRTWESAEFLNILGNQGWELVWSDGGHSAYFGMLKREVSKDNPPLPEFEDKKIRLENKRKDYTSFLSFKTRRV